MRIRSRAIAAAALAATLTASAQPALAQGQRGYERTGEPGPGEMMGDLFVARPIGAALFAVGTATFVVGLPFIMAGGNVPEAGEALIVRPAQEAFVRCLGCSTPGWRSEYDGRTD